MFKIAALSVGMSLLCLLIANNPVLAQLLPGREPIFYFPQIPANRFPPYLEQAFSSFAKGEYEQCLKVAQAYAKKPQRLAGFEKVSLLAGLCQQGLGKHEAAIESFYQSLRLRGSSSDAYFLLGLSYLALAKPLEAKSALQDALWFSRVALVPLAEIQLYAAHTLRLANETAKAISTLTAALASAPDFTPAKALLAEIQLASGNRSQAVKLLREASLQSPSDDTLRLELAQTLYQGADRTLQRSDIMEARALLERMATNRNLPAALEAEYYPLRIRTLLALGELDQAQKVLEQAHVQQKTDSPALLELQQQLATEFQAKVAPAVTP